MPGSLLSCNCRDFSIETAAHVYGLINTVFSSAELLCYTVLVSALHVILEKQKKKDINVCDMSIKTFDDLDDCEIKAGKVAAALLATSVFDVLISFLALRGAYQGNICFCYIWFTFTGLLILLFPLLQGIFFIVTNWWNFVSYSIISISVIHSVIKIIGMIVIIRFVRWMRKSSFEKEHEEKNDIPSYDPLQVSWSIGQGFQPDVGIIGLPGNNSKPNKPPDNIILKEQLSEPSNDSSSISNAE